MVYPGGVIKDVLVNIHKFIFPAKFVILDMKEDEKVPIILGCPFLNTCVLVVEVRPGRLTLCLSDEKVVFNLFDSVKKTYFFFYYQFCSV